MKALEEMKGEPGIDAIKTIVLSGSVLKRDYDFTKIKHLRNVTIINDCAVSDIPLLFSEAFVIGTGMAGITGFRGLSNDTIKNRYFSGGHSHFFDRSENFIDKYWLPIFKGDIHSSDEDVKSSFFYEFLTNSARISSKFKAFYPLIIVALLAYAFFV